jgi:hypothetical protein
MPARAARGPSIHEIRYRFVRRLLREVDGKRGKRTSDAICVENRDYHQLSRFEIDGGKRISRHLYAVAWAVVENSVSLTINLDVLSESSFIARLRT